MTEFNEESIKDILKSIKELIVDQRKSTMRSIPAQKQLPISEPSKGDGTFQAPIKGEWKSSGGFSISGLRPNKRSGHMGVDMRCSGGTSVYPLTNGIVSNVSTDPIGGNIVNIKHNSGLSSYYAHLGTINVHRGDEVNKNTIIGTVGNSGNARNTFSHLHFGTAINGVWIDPARFFSVPNYQPLTKDEQMWLPGAKEQASKWSMEEHLKQPRKAFTKNVNEIVRLCNTFYIMSCSS